MKFHLVRMFRSFSVIVSSSLHQGTRHSGHLHTQADVQALAKVHVPTTFSAFSRAGESLYTFSQSQLKKKVFAFRFSEFLVLKRILRWPE